MDDLVIHPMSAIPITTLRNELDFKEKVVELGEDEVRFFVSCFCLYDKKFNQIKL